MKSFLKKEIEKGNYFPEKRNEFISSKKMNEIGFQVQKSNSFQVFSGFFVYLSLFT